MTCILVLLYLCNQTSSLEAMQKYMRGSECYAEGDYVEALRIYNDVIAMDSTLHEVYATYGMALVQVGLVDSAQRMYERLIERYPDDHAIHYNLALIYMSSNDFKKALSSVNEAIKLNDEEAAYFFTRASINLHYPRRYSEIVNDLHKALELQPGMYSAAISLAEVLIELGNEGEAIEVLENVYSFRPMTVYDVYMHGKVSELLSKWEAALSCFMEIYNTNPNYSDVRLEIAQCYQMLNDSVNAERFLQEAANEEQSVYAYCELGRLYKEKGDFGRALHMYQCALQHTPDSADVYVYIASLYYVKDDFDSAFIWSRHAYENSPQNPKCNLYLGFLNFLCDSVELAKTFTMKALELDSSYAQAWMNLASIYHVCGSEDSADICFTKVRVQPDLADQYCFFGYIFCERMDYIFARRLFRYALKEDSCNTRYLFTLGLICDYMDDYDGALKYYAKTVQIDPRDYVAHENMARIYYEREQYGDAKQSYLNCIREPFEDHLPYFSLATIYIREYKYDSALIMMKEVVAREPDSSHWHSYIGYLHMQLENYDEALKAFHIALNLSPEDSMSMVGVSDVYICTRNYKSAKEAILKCLAKWPGISHLHYSLGIIYSRENDYPNVIKELNRYLELKPNARDREDVMRMINEARRALEQ
jgi:tetratricopeptide (TPR) repeat protein